MKILVDKAVIKQALEALEMIATYSEEDKQCDNGYGAAWVANTAITALREASSGDAVSPVEQAEQEPVAYTNIDQLGYLKDPLYENAPMAMWSKPFDERINVPLYAAPVRTKDLTDDEIGTLVQRHTIDGKIMPFALCEAVIAADREKNRVLPIAKTTTPE